jgi:hypothetical protein
MRLAVQNLRQSAKASTLSFLEVWANLMPQFEDVSQKLPRLLVETDFVLNNFFKDVTPLIQMLLARHNGDERQLIATVAVALFNQIQRTAQVEPTLYPALALDVVDLSYSAAMPVIVPAHEVAEKVDVFAAQVSNRYHVVGRHMVDLLNTRLLQCNFEELVEYVVQAVDAAEATEQDRIIALESVGDDRHSLRLRLL